MNELAMPILLVEDDDNDAYFFERAFKKADVANPLRRVRDGQDAIKYLSGGSEYADRTLHPLPGLVILDLNLPVRNGLEVLRWMRSKPETRSTIVVVLTSSIDALDVHEAYVLGANSYLVKPADPNQLIAVVEAIKNYWLSVNAPPPQAPAAHRLRYSPPNPTSQTTP